MVREALKLLPILILLLLSCKGEEKGQKVSKLKVSTYKAKEVSLEVFYPAVGTIKDERDIYLLPEVSGRVVKIFVKEGQKVKGGQTLLKIDDRELKLTKEELVHNLKALSSNLESLEKSYKRNQRLYRKGLISEESFERIKSQYESTLEKYQALKKKLEATELRLKKTEVKAPYGGVISELKVKVGQLVSPSTPLMRLTSNSQKYLEFLVPPQTPIKPGSKVIFKVKGLGEFPGKVYYLSPTLNRQHLRKVKATLEGVEKLSVGSFGEVLVEVGKERVFKIPERAVILSPEGDFVYTLEGTKAKRVKVDLVKVKGGFAYVRGKLKGKEVITTNLFELSEGKEVIK